MHELWPYQRHWSTELAPDYVSAWQEVRAAGSISMAKLATDICLSYCWPQVARSGCKTVQVGAIWAQRAFKKITMPLLYSLEAGVQVAPRELRSPRHCCSQLWSAGSLHSSPELQLCGGWGCGSTELHQGSFSLFSAHTAKIRPRGISRATSPSVRWLWNVAQCLPLAIFTLSALQLAKYLSFFLFFWSLVALLHFLNKETMLSVSPSSDTSTLPGTSQALRPETNSRNWRLQLI